TGIDTRPKESESEAIERAAMEAPRSLGNAPAWARRTGSIRAGSSTCHVAGTRRRRRRCNCVAKCLRHEAERLHGRAQGLLGLPVSRPGVDLLEAQVFARRLDR